MKTFALKWRPDDPSESIMLTFDGKWAEAIANESITVAYRKMWPNNVNPVTMYAYLSSPVSAITARVQISWSLETLDCALALSAQSGHSPTEIRSYFGERDEITVIQFNSISHATQRITLRYLKEHYHFWPSSTFIPLSSFGVQTLNELGKFEETKGLR